MKVTEDKETRETKLQRGTATDAQQTAAEAEKTDATMAPVKKETTKNRRSVTDEVKAGMK